MGQDKEYLDLDFPFARARVETKVGQRGNCNTSGARIFSAGMLVRSRLLPVSLAAWACFLDAENHAPGQAEAAQTTAARGPSVAICSPAGGAIVRVGRTQEFTATAREPGGAIANVQYFLDSKLIGISSDEKSRYPITRKFASSGHFSFTAVATDRQGRASPPSAPVTVTVPRDSDKNGLADEWEMQYFGHIGNDPKSSPDKNGYTLLQDCQAGANPWNPYSQPGPHGPVMGCPPPMFSPEGEDFSSDEEVTLTAVPAGAIIYYTTDGGVPTVHSPSMASGGTIKFSKSETIYAMASHAGYQDSATSRATYNFKADPGLVPPSDVVCAPGASDGEIEVTWDNNSTDAKYNLVYQSLDGKNWHVIAKINEPTQCSYRVTGLTVGRKYYFAVAAGN